VQLADLIQSAVLQLEQSHLPRPRSSRGRSRPRHRFTHSLRELSGQFPDFEAYPIKLVFGNKSTVLLTLRARGGKSARENGDFPARGTQLLLEVVLCLLR
jgi:hypothetical protein